MWHYSVVDTCYIVDTFDRINIIVDTCDIINSIVDTCDLIKIRVDNYEKIDSILDTCFRIISILDKYSNWTCDIFAVSDLSTCKSNQRPNTPTQCNYCRNSFSILYIG